MARLGPVFAVALVLLPYIGVCGADALPSSYPHQYPGQPAGDFGPQWQQYFQVTGRLPNITFPVGRSFAGNLPVNRPGHPNNTLFFVGFEKSNGSLTAPASAATNEPWGIWLNGGPGSSSMAGLFFENGPIRIESNYSASPNNYSWDRLADFFWLDQPVGVGFSTADSDGYVASEDQMAADFMGFLANLVKVFPSLATRPLHLTGESYAGVYIPYIMKAYFGLQNPPVKIRKIAIGDGSITSGQVFELLPVLNVIETHPQLIGYDPDVYNYFKEQTHLCGYDVNLTYPQKGVIPSVPLRQAALRQVPFALKSQRQVMSELQLRYSRRSQRLSKRDREMRRLAWKRDLSLRTNGTIDPWYGCILIGMMIDYAVNYTYPWSLSKNTNTFGFDVYDATDATNPEPAMDGSIFLNNAQTRAALHAPTSKDWTLNFPFVFGNLTADPSPEPMVFLTELATNSTSHGVGVVLFSGNDDTLIQHRGTEVAIQNTTFGGIQGFTVKPSTPWQNDAGTFAGIIRQERNWTYVLFDRAGHLVPAKQPGSAFTFFREFVLGSNPTGLVTQTSRGIQVIGGVNSTLAEDVLPGGDEVFYGSGATQSTYVAPSATRAAWRSFIRTATATASPTAGVNAAMNSNAEHRALPSGWFTIIILYFIIFGF